MNLDFDWADLRRDSIAIDRKRKAEDDLKSGSTKHTPVEVETHFQFSIPMEFLAAHPHHYAIILSQLEKIRSYSSALSPIEGEQIEHDCSWIFDQVREPQAKIRDYAALLYLLRTSQYATGCGFTQKLAYSLYMEACARRSQHKSIMGESRKILSSDHELYLIKHFARMLYQEDGSYNNGGICLIRYCLLSSEIQIMFKPSHIKQMLSTLDSIEKEPRFVTLCKRAPAVHAKMGDYICCSQMLPKGFAVTPFYLCIELMIFLLCSKSQGKTRICYVVGSIRYLKESSPFLLCKYLMQIYATGKVRLGKHFVRVSDLIEDEVDEIRRKNYRAEANIADLPLVECIRVMLPYERMPLFANTTRELFEGGYLKSVFSAQIYNITEIIARSTLQLLGINGRVDSPIHIKKCFLDALFDYMNEAAIKFSPKEEQACRTIFSENFWFIDHSLSKVVQEGVLTIIQRGQRHRTFELGAGEHQALLASFRMGRALCIIHEGRLLEIETASAFYRCLVGLLSSLKNLKFHPRKIILFKSLSLFLQKFIENQFQSLEAKASVGSFKGELFFSQGGGSATPILEDLGLAVVDCRLAADNGATFLDVFAKRCRDPHLPPMPRTVIFQTKGHICTATIPHKPDELATLAERMLTLGRNRLQASCPPMLDDFIRACFGSDQIVKHKADILERSREVAWTFAALKEYCLLMDVDQDIFIFEFQQLIEKISPSIDDLVILLAKLFPALNDAQFNQIRTKIYFDKASITHTPSELAHKMRKELILLGFQNVDSSQIEAELRSLAQLPPFFQIGYTNWNFESNPIFWTVGFSYSRQEVVLFKTNKRMNSYLDDESLRDASLIYTT